MIAMVRLYSFRISVFLYLLEIFATLSAVSANSIDANYDFDTYKVIEHKRSLTLQCNFTLDPPKSDFVLKWLKNGQPINQESDNRIEIKAGENILLINKATDNDAGNYTCVVSAKKGNASQTDLRAEFNVISKPYLKMPDYHSFVEGERLSITCTVIGTPTPNVSWIVGNQTYNESTDRIKLLANDKGVPKSRFEIEESTMDDRSMYTCVAWNIACRNSNSSETKTFVRIKDKLAALWPFLGICAEVIVLCTIILIYEKKRNKTELDESDTDGSPEQKNTPDHGKDSDVRQRK